MKKVILVLAAMAWAVTGFFTSTPRAARSAGNGVFEPASPILLQDDVNELRIAVTPPYYDDIGSVLESMGWAYTEIQETQLTDNEFLTQFDVIFINCPFYASDSARNAQASLEQFVRQGGTVYASDNAYEYIEKSFPGYIDFYDRPGDVGAQTIDADVVDPGLAQALNSSTLQLHFELTRWVPIDSVTDEVTVYLSGDFTIFGGTPAGNSPLATSFAYGDGRVVYTAFHNQEQTTEEENKLLNYLVFVTTSEELSSRLQESLAGGGYGMQVEFLGSINAGTISPSYIYSNPSITDLAIGLNWQEGTMRLSVFNPDGSLYTQLEGSPPLIIEIPDAEAGDWSYQVEAIDVPHEHFSYVVQIGLPAIVVAPPPTTPENPAATNEVAQGSQGSSLYLVIGGVLCLALLSAVVLIGVVIFFVKRRKA